MAASFSWPSLRVASFGRTYHAGLPTGWLALVLILQDNVRDLNEILPSSWNEPSKPISMLEWLVADRSTEDGHRLHALGNIVVPQQAVVGWHVLFKMLAETKSVRQ